MPKLSKFDKEIAAVTNQIADKVNCAVYNIQTITGFRDDQAVIDAVVDITSAHQFGVGLIEFKICDAWFAIRYEENAAYTDFKPTYCIYRISQSITKRP